MFILDTVTCGAVTIDEVVPNVISFVVTMIKIIVPIVLIIFGMLDMFKAVIANDDKEMKEAQKKLIHRIIYAVIVFFVIALVQFVFSTLSQKGGSNATACIDCFINGSCTDAQSQ